jgi:uncharacterized protein (DUF362 family)
MHVNENKQVAQNALECLVTHPSCLRAICDYCIIALQGEGKIIIGDAPMQGCHLDELLLKLGYNDILTHYQNQGIGVVSFMDFRAYQTEMNSHKVILKKTATKSRGIDVALDSLSAHATSDFRGYYQVSDYDKEVTTSYHRDERHVYSINEAALQADMIIEFSKPKCHRLAGMTGAMKNLVGVVYKKETLPHRKEGSVDEGGDAYRYKSWIKRAIDAVLTKKIRLEERGRSNRAVIMRYLYGVLYYASKAFCKDPYLIGSWYGNDTIWRTCVDLNYIMTFSDKAGVIQKKPQRSVLHFADMIIAGEHNGPISPSPKALGLILAGDDASAMDRVICQIMGFDHEQIPLLRALAEGGTRMEYIIPVLTSNNVELSGRLDKIDFPKSWTFIPHDSWSLLKEDLHDA